MALQILCAVLILAACFISKALVLVAGLISMMYMFSDAKWEQKFAFFMFMLSFSPIFKFDKDQTSLFMFLRLAVVFSYVFQRREKFSFTFVTILITFTAYCFVLSEIYNTDYISSLINIVLWSLIGYIIAVTLKSEDVTPVTRCLVNGVIFTGIIGLFINDIPQLASEVRVLSSYAEDGALVNRYAGFWTDPNFFTVLLITSVWLVYLEYNKKKINFTEFTIRCLLISFIGTMTMSKSCLLLFVVFWLYVVIVKNDIRTVSKVSLVFLMIFAIIIFLWKNPYWLSDIFYRFGSSKEQTTMSTITTGRTDIWIEYLKIMLDDFSWLFGHGVNPELYLVNGIGKGSHNTYIQSIFSFGLLGTILYISVFNSIYTNAKAKVISGIRTNKGPERFALISILITMFFLDGINIEMYYYMIPLTFVYLFNKSVTPDVACETGLLNVGRNNDKSI